MAFDSQPEHPLLLLLLLLLLPAGVAERHLALEGRGYVDLWTDQVQDQASDRHLVVVVVVVVVVECGLTLNTNEYYTSNVSGTIVNAFCPEDPPGSNNCGSRKGLAQPTFSEWTAKYGNDQGSTLSPLPSDEELMGAGEAWDVIRYRYDLSRGCIAKGFS